MKWRGWVLLAIFTVTSHTSVVNALETIPTTPSKVSGPFNITAYSFGGSGLRYVQVHNSSSSLATLDGWQIASATKVAPTMVTNYLTLSGQLEPGRHIFASISGVVDRPSFVLPTSLTTGNPNVATVSLIAPIGSGFNDETVTVPTITASVQKEVDGASMYYHLKRDVSATTGNYLSGFTFIAPTEKLKNDQLYVPPPDPNMQIVEIYSDSLVCSPFDTAATCSDYVKLYNASTTSVNLSSFRLRTGSYGQTATSSSTKSLGGVVGAGGYATFVLSLSSSGSWVWLEDVYGSVRYENTLIEFPSNAGFDHQAWAYDDDSDEWRWTTTPSPGDSPNNLPPKAKINECDGLRITEIVANVSSEDQYIEVTNMTDDLLDIEGCILQTNRSASASHIFASAGLLPGQRLVVYVKDSPLTLTKTTSGSVYVLSSDMTTEVDSVNYADLAEATSYALIDDSWKVTYRQTPGAVNLYQEYPACAEGYARSSTTGQCVKAASVITALSDCGEGKYRSEETNRCRSLETPSVLQPCDSDQYRSAETNRCRSLVSTASVLAPCAVDQERNPQTNRCRAIASADELKPCAVNQERNPETNRCRALASSTQTDFPVEAVAQGSQATLGWWAFGGVGMLAAGYAGWEWRREVSGWVRRLGRFGIGRS